MGDLISRSSLEAWVRLNYSPHQSIAVIDLEQKLKTMPTAYDVEAVVAELEKLKESVFGCDDTKCSKCKYKSQCFNVDKGHKVALDKAISIVRGKE